jgi:hypothetical protein
VGETPLLDAIAIGGTAEAVADRVAQEVRKQVLEAISAELVVVASSSSSSKRQRRCGGE